MYETINFEKNDRVAVITLCRPERLNAFNLKLEDEFQAALKEAERDTDVRVIVVRGAGERAFSSGYDLIEETEQEEFSPAAWAERLARDFDFTLSVWRCPKPTLAAIRGYCVAGAWSSPACATSDTARTMPSSVLLKRDSPVESLPKYYLGLSAPSAAN